MTIFICVIGVLALAGCLQSGQGGEVVKDWSTTNVVAESGYRFSGPYDLEATATWTDAGGWTVAGSFMFPTAGYVVDGPEIRILKRLPEHVTVGFTITPPNPDAITAQVLTRVPFEESILVSPDATFELVVQPPDTESP